MTDHTDYAPKPRPMRVVAPEQPLSDILRAADLPPQRPLAPLPDPPAPAAPSWLQVIAHDVAQLTYGEMKDLARGVLGKDDQAEIIVLADRLHEWAQQAKVPT